MRNLYAVFTRVLAICKSFSFNFINDKVNIVRPRPVPTFSDREIIALSLSSEILSIGSELHLFRIIQPDCPQISSRIGSRRNFNNRRKNVFDLINSFRLRIAHKREENPPLFCLNFMPLLVCKNSRARRSKICQDISESFPTFGFCASQIMHYFGYKLHAVCSSSGVIYDMDLSQANVHDIHYLNDLKISLSNCILVGDKGYLNAQIQVDLFTYYNIKLEVPYRNNQIHGKPDNQRYKRMRRRIETNFSQLDDQFMIRKNYAKLQRGLFSRILTKITAFTTLQFLNKLNSRPIGYLKVALIDSF